MVRPVDQSQLHIWAFCVVQQAKSDRHCDVFIGGSLQKTRRERQRQRVTQNEAVAPLVDQALGDDVGFAVVRRQSDLALGTCCLR